MLKDTLNADLKQAMLARETEKVETLRGVKSAILYEEVAKDKRDSGLSGDEILAVLKKESKKRQDSIDLYRKGGRGEQADKEQREKSIIDAYLPEQLGEDAVNELIDKAMDQMGIAAITKQDMGRVIGAAKSRGGAEVDGAMLAGLVKARINS